MIPTAFITHWRTRVPWENDAQIEQDLIISRIIAEIYNNKLIQDNLAFRGGTALQKLFYQQPVRYSEDIDLVQIQAQPIGSVVNGIRNCLDSWLAEPSWKQNAGRFILNYRFETEMQPVTKMRIKIEINTREHFAVKGFHIYPFKLNSPWLEKEALVRSYQLEELLGTKLRALYQRKKGRDLFDLAIALEKFNSLDINAIINCFGHYLKTENKVVLRAEFEKSLTEKINDVRFAQDIFPLLPVDERNQYQPERAFYQVMSKVISMLPGDPWKLRDEK